MITFLAISGVIAWCVVIAFVALVFTTPDIDAGSCPSCGRCEKCGRTGCRCSK